MNTIERIRQRGCLVAGVSKGIFGLSYRNPGQNWSGFDVDLAKAVAVAVLGDAKAIEFVSVAPEQRCQAVASGLVDIGTFNASATLSREVNNDVFFPQAMIYDGEAMLVRKEEMQGFDPALGVRGLSKRVVAIQQGATTKANLERFFAENKLDYELRAYATPQQALEGYASAECNLYALDLIPLSGERLRLPQPEQHIILEEQISKEAMGPVVAGRDSAWIRSVTWIMRSLIEAEELGLNSQNCNKFAGEDGHLKRFLHPDAKTLEVLGLQQSFPLMILQQIGNYAEVFARNLGDKSPLQLPRMKNKLWSQGGLLISPSFD